MPRTPLDVTCPKCGAAINAQCRGRTNGRTTDTHKARWEEAFPDWPTVPPFRVLRADNAAKQVPENLQTSAGKET